MIAKNRHSIGILAKDGSPVVMALSERFSESAPDKWKPLAESAINCCKFLEQFGLAGHFTFGLEAPLTCIGMTNLNTPIQEVYAKGGDIPALTLPATLTLSIYSGLVYITDNPLQYAFESEKMKYVDSTEAVGWDKHVVLSVDYRVKKGDVAYGIFIFEKTEKEVLKQVGSYNSFEEKITGEDDKELDAPEKVKEAFRKLYGKKYTAGKIKGIDRDNKNN